MRLANIDDVNVSFVLIRLKKLLDRTDRAKKRRSRTASEEQHHRLSLQRRKRHGLLALHVFDSEIWRGIPHFQFTGQRRLGERSGRQYRSSRHRGECVGPSLHNERFQAKGRNSYKFS